jgi:hypothetical protein
MKGLSRMNSGVSSTLIVVEAQSTLLGLRDRAADLYGRMTLGEEPQTASRALALYQTCEEGPKICAEMREIADRKAHEGSVL